MLELGFLADAMDTPVLCGLPGNWGGEEGEGILGGRHGYTCDVWTAKELDLVLLCRNSISQGQLVIILPSAILVCCMDWLCDWI